MLSWLINKFFLSLFLGASLTLSGDLNRDGVSEEYRLRDGVLTVTENAALLWQSPPEWWVSGLAVEDITNDGSPDLSLSVWKAGNYGPSKPFWVEKNDQSVKNHFFIFNFDEKGKKLKPVWQSSNLAVPNCAFAVRDADGDGRNDLVATEGDYADWPRCRARAHAVWKWNGWGFSNESREPL